MDRKRWQTPAFIVLVALAAGCNRGDQPKGDQARAGREVTEPAKEMAGMQTKDMPGMAMSGGEVMVDPAKQQLIGMRMVEATYQPLEKTIRTVGRVDYNERKLKQINAKTEGWIERLYVDFTGQLVKRGDPLFTLYSPELVSTQEEYLLALQAKQQTSSSPFHHVAAGGSSLLEAARRRLQLWDVTPEQIADLERNGRPSKTLTLVSPIDGFVIEKTALEGMRVEPSMVLYKIADLSSVWIYADIYEYELPLVRVGQQATVRLSYEPGRTFQGRVVYVYPYLDSKTRTAKVRLELPNTGDRRLKPGMFADIELKVALGRRLAVPQEAILDSGTRQIVFVEKGKGHFEPKEVTLGLRVDGRQEIVSGLTPGTQVVASANFFLDSESRLRESMGLMAGMAGMERMRTGGMEGMQGMEKTEPGAQMTAKAPTGPQEKRVNDITLTFSTVPSPPKVGQNLLRVRLTDSTGEVIRNAKVSFSFTMPMPGMSAVKADGSLTKDGSFETKALLGMGGTWQVTVKVTIPGKPEIEQMFAVGAGGGQ
ncbi:MAG: efflux RND transporter periplasmic adaptor subunit [Candidatus Methylomirabilis oxyfera]|nr:efflux RND transporter periplasmic adaptor subunit [Candidatus Methylomirabilis oxyfera]